MTTKIFLVGAGPGDPDLLTLRALRLIQSADIILHDDLVSPAILALAPPSTEVRNVGKRCGRKCISQGEINARMIELARAGRRVVRLHGGDPAVFGRVGEEIRALTSTGVGFEVVPGITAPLGAAAAAGVPLTERLVASSVLFLTAHRAVGRLKLDWPGPLPPETTVVIYMPGDDFGLLAAELCSAGLALDTPCLIVSRATTAEEQIGETTLEELPRVERLPAPKVLIVGAVVGQRQASEAAEAVMLS